MICNDQTLTSVEHSLKLIFPYSKNGICHLVKVIDTDIKVSPAHKSERVN